MRGLLYGDASQLVAEMVGSHAPDEVAHLEEVAWRRSIDPSGTAERPVLGVRGDAAARDALRRARGSTAVRTLRKWCEVRLE